MLFKGAVDLNHGGFGLETGQAIVLDNVGCLGNEAVLTSCVSSIPNYDRHYQDAGIRCKPGIVIARSILCKSCFLLT